MEYEECASGAASVDKFSNISVSERRQIIEDWIFSERDRYILTRRLIDGITVAKIAQELEDNPKFGYMSTRGIDYVIQRGKQVILNHISL